MAKKIIILNGSPRKKGNTSAMVEAFTKGAEQAGHTVTTFFIDRMNIRPCKGCFGGGRDPQTPCVQKDDMDLIYPEYENADVVVFASPMYFWSITGQLKCVLDRLFAVAEKSSDYHIDPKECVMLMAAEGTGESNEAPVVDYYNSLLKHLNWTDRGLIIASGVGAVGAIEGHPALERCFRLGLIL